MTTSLAPRPQVRPHQPYLFPTPQTHSLGNGMRVEHFPHHSRLIRLSLVTHVGRWHEPDGMEGLSLLTTDARIEGSARHTGEQFAAALDRIGSGIATSAEAGVSVVWMDVAESHLSQGLALLAESAIEPVYPPNEVARIRNKLLDECLSRRNSPAGRVDDVIRRLCFAPSAREAAPLYGTEASIKNLRQEDVLAFHATNLIPHRTTLLVGGVTDTTALVEIVEEHYGNWSTPRAAEHAGERRPAFSSPAEGPAIVIVNRPNAVQTAVRLGKICIPRTHPQYAALRLGVQAWGGSMTSRLSTVMREEKGYTYGVSASIEALPDRTLLTVDTSVDVPATESALEDLISITTDLRDTGLTSDEARRSANELLLGAPLQFQSSSAIVTQRFEELGEDLPFGWLNDHRAALAAATADDASAALADSLDLRNPHLALVGDAEMLLPIVTRLFPSTPASVEEF